MSVTSCVFLGNKLIKYEYLGDSFVIMCCNVHFFSL